MRLEMVIRPTPLLGYVGVTFPFENVKVDSAFQDSPTTWKTVQGYSRRARDSLRYNLQVETPEKDLIAPVLERS